MNKLSSEKVGWPYNGKHNTVAIYAHMKGAYGKLHYLTWKRMIV